MKALIIAAGTGDRLKSLTKNKPKPLLKLLDISLIKRIILEAKKAGINEFIIVVGYMGEKIKKELGNGKNWGVKIDYIENNEWKRGNGVSVLKARKIINENFILLMADHIFDGNILKKLTDEKLDSNEGIIVIDKNPKDYIDIKEATKVKIENNRIVEIGKKIDEYNGIDCGIFLFSPSIFTAIEESIRIGEETLSAGIKILAKNGKMICLDIGNNFWIDIDTKKDFREGEKILCKNLIKPTDGPISRYLNRQISTRISKYLVNTKIKPNTISFLGLIICFVSTFLFTFGSYFYILIAGILVQFSSIIDGCDGEVARLRFQQSNSGAWFDASLDRYADALIIFGMTYGFWNLNSNVSIWIFGFFALIGSFMNSYTADKYDSIFKNKKRRIRLGRDLRLFLIMTGAILNQIFYTLVILGILTNIESIRRLYILRNE